MTNQRTPLLKWIVTLCALPFVISNLHAQTKVLINAFDNAAEVSATGKNWGNWFGTAYLTCLWDASDASNNVNSGSLKLEAFYPDSGAGGCCGPQFVLYNQNNGINPALTGNGGNPSSPLATNIEFDVRFDTTTPNGGPVWGVTNATSTNWPTIEVGTRGVDFGQHDFGTFTLPVTNTNWNHISIAIGASANWTNIPNVFFKYYGGSAASNWVVMYIDNIVITTAPVPPAPIYMGIQKAKPGLRLFSGPSQYSRSQLVAVDTNQSWVGGTYPVSYSFDISAYDVNPPINEFHMFLTPLAFDQGGVINEYTDYSTASNNLRLLITGGAAGTSTVIAQVDWKTNIINSNPTQIALTITNPTMIGTWTLTFNSPSTGTLKAPGAAPAAFTIGDPNVSTDFANPMAFFIGVQPDPTTAIGQHLEMTGVRTAGVASPGVPINSDLTTGIDTNIWSMGATESAIWMLPVTNTTSWWVSSSYPDSGAVLATTPNLASAVPWQTPQYYTGFDTNGYYEHTLGTNTWRLLPAAALPTVDGNSNSVKSANAFFRLQSPAPAQ